MISQFFEFRIKISSERPLAPYCLRILIVIFQPITSNKAISVKGGIVVFDASLMINGCTATEHAVENTVFLSVTAAVTPS